MSEEKLYAVKNDEGKYWDFSANSGFWSSKIAYPNTTIRKKQAEQVADERGGHIVPFVEEPEKVVITKEQAKIVEHAHGYMLPAEYITDNTDGGYESERLLMEAFVNGYTVAKEKKYNVKVPKKWSGDDKRYWTKKQDGALTWVCLINTSHMIAAQQFTLTEIEHYGLQDCEKEEVTDDE